ncbi:hypothetical protein GCM10007086_19750 [Photobacterium aphoticum]|nr:hypothetical protein GCM10007086_19750 [Photobacterium aphoticum]
MCERYTLVEAMGDGYGGWLNSESRSTIPVTIVILIEMITIINTIIGLVSVNQSWRVSEEKDGRDDQYPSDRR